MSEKENQIILARMQDMMLKLQGFEQTSIQVLQRTYINLSQELAANLKASKAGTWNQARLLAMLQEVEIAIAAINGVIANQTAVAVVDAGGFSYASMNNILSWDQKTPGFNNISPSREQLAQMVTTQKLGGKTLDQWIASAIGPDIGEIKDEIIQGKIRGEGYRKTVDRIVDELSVDRLSKKGRDLETVTISYMQAMNAKAQDDIYKANESVVEQVEWSAIMENGNTKTGKGTCPRCQALDGQIYPLEGPKPALPLHPRCRCIWLPITKSWKDLGFDIEEMNTEYNHWYIRDPQTGKKLSYGKTTFDYGQWWSNQSKLFQNNAVGVRRADLIRANKIKFNDIVDDRTGELIPLKDLYIKFNIPLPGDEAKK